MNKTESRRQMIRRLIVSRPVATQGELVGLLGERGINSTQASISRDIAALGLIKLGGRYTLPHVPVAAGDLRRKLAGRIQNARTAGDNLIVLHTNAGEASAVGLALDAARWPSIVGTIAGDDTVLIICDGRGDQRHTVASLREIVPDAFA